MALVDLVFVAGSVIVGVSIAGVSLSVVFLENRDKRVPYMVHRPALSGYRSVREHKRRNTVDGDMMTQMPT